MDLKVLHSFMSKKGYHYFEGQTNDSDNLYLSFSTLHSGSGDSMDIRIGVIDNDIKSWVASAETSDYVITELKNISDSEVFSFISNNFVK